LPLFAAMSDIPLLPASLPGSTLDVEAAIKSSEALSATA
jgi:hypothetical protein